MRLPRSYGGKLGDVTATALMKGYTASVLCTGVGRFILKDAVSDEATLRAILDLLDWLESVSCYVISRSELQRLEAKIPKILWALERRLPVFTQTITLHMVLHVCASIRWAGPIRVTWTYALERALKMLRDRLFSAKHPIVTLVREIRVMEYRSSMGLFDQSLDSRWEKVSAGLTAPSMLPLYSLHESVLELLGRHRIRIFTAGERGLIQSMLDAIDPEYSALRQRWRTETVDRPACPLATWTPVGADDTEELSGRQLLMRTAPSPFGHSYIRVSLNGVIFRAIGSSVSADPLASQAMKWPPNCVAQVAWTDASGAKRLDFCVLESIIDVALVCGDATRAVAIVRWLRISSTDKVSKLDVVEFDNRVGNIRTAIVCDQLMPSTVVLVKGITGVMAVHRMYAITLRKASVNALSMLRQLPI